MATVVPARGTEGSGDQLDLPWPRSESPAAELWKGQKKLWRQKNAHLDKLMSMVGLEHIKNEFVEQNAVVQIAKRQRRKVTKERFNVVFIANPGTGKTTVADLYVRFLYSVDAIPGDKVLSYSAIALDSLGVAGIETALEQLDSGGAFILEESHHIASSGSKSTAALFDFLLSKVDNLRGKVVFIFTGYGKHMETLCVQNPAFPSLFPKTLRFSDYQDHELHQLLIRELESQFPKTLKVEEGRNGLYMRIVARRLGRGSGRYGFGNVREVQNAVSMIQRRQASRLSQPQKTTSHNKGDLLVLTREDLIGPPPSTAFDRSVAWRTLQDLIGLRAVKNTVKALIHQLQINYDRELAEKPLVQCSLNKLFLGNPGTGKTTVAALYGQILADLGLLSNGEVVLKQPGDFIGDALGVSERNTLAILNATRGKVLVIDEAYSLLRSGGDQGDGSVQDPFRAAVIDTIVGEVHSTAVEDRCVLLLGYREKMESMLNESNEGLARRFPLATAFEFEDYSPVELREILNLKLHHQAFRVNEEAVDAACEELERSRNRPRFGNAAEVDILLDKAKERQHWRLKESGVTGECDVLRPEDFDPDFGRGVSRSLLDVRKLFDNMVGCDEIIEKLEELQLIVRNMKTLSMDRPEGVGADARGEIPFTFVFSGPPGTGKTTTAKKMGDLYYDLGFLSTNEVLERSATDLVGEYVGHTGPKTKRVFDAALGRVLLIDEAYKLAEGSFGKDAIVEIINCLSQTRYRNKLVIILAGYEHELHKLMAVNDGLSSRFPEVLRFKPPTSEQCKTLLYSCLKTKGLDVAALETSEELNCYLSTAFTQLSGMPSWGAARDVHTLATKIYRTVLKARHERPSLVVDSDAIPDAVASLLIERKRRKTTSRQPQCPVPSEKEPKQLWTLSPPTKSLHSTPHKPKINIKKIIGVKRRSDTEMGVEELPKAKRVTELDIKDSDGADGLIAEDDNGIEEIPRDPGVPDHVWIGLQEARKAARQHQRDIGKSFEAYHIMLGEVQKIEVKLASATTLQEKQSLLDELDVAENNAAEQKKRVDEEQAAEKRESEIQSRLADKCLQGYKWLKEGQGYRCAGGMHYISMEQIQSGNWEPLTRYS